MPALRVDAKGRGGRARPSTQAPGGGRRYEPRAARGRGAGAGGRPEPTEAGANGERGARGGGLHQHGRGLAHGRQVAEELAARSNRSCSQRLYGGEPVGRSEAPR